MLASYKDDKCQEYMSKLDGVTYPTSNFTLNSRCFIHTWAKLALTYFTLKCNCKDESGPLGFHPGGHPPCTVTEISSPRLKWQTATRQNDTSVYGMTTTKNNGGKLNSHISIARLNSRSWPMLRFLSANLALSCQSGWSVFSSIWSAWRQGLMGSVVFQCRHQTEPR